MYIITEMYKKKIVKLLFYLVIKPKIIYKYFLFVNLFFVLNNLNNNKQLLLVNDACLNLQL